jgi:hypothetical protein
MKILEEPLRFDALIVVKLRAVFCLDGLKRSPCLLMLPLTRRLIAALSPGRMHARNDPVGRSNTR